MSSPPPPSSSLIIPSRPYASSVIFIAGNMPMVSEITPLIIIGKLEQYDYAGATAVATVMLVISFFMLLVINTLQAWQRKRAGAQT